MTDDQLRAVIRDEVAHQLGSAGASRTDALRQGAAHISPGAPAGAWSAVEHSSHARFPLPAADDGACIIEPRVRCTHCGYCKSYGH